MSARKPKPGSMLTNDDGDYSAMVITRGISDERLAEMWRAYFGDERPVPTAFRFATWHLHSAEQNRSESHDCDVYWSTEGWCRTFVDVAIPVAAGAAPLPPDLDLTAPNPSLDAAAPSEPGGQP